MKTTITALFLVFSSFVANAQSQNFESAGTISSLQSNCWLFYGFSESTNAPIAGTRHIYVVPTTSTDNNTQANSNIGQIATPYMNFTNASTVGFKYRLSTNLNGNADRYISVRLFNGSSSTPLSTITIPGGTKGGDVFSSSISIPANKGVQRLVLDFTGQGDGNTGMYFDDLVINGATYAYNTSNCASLAASMIVMPVKLLNFSGSIVNKKAEMQWSVAENETGERFEIEKSTDGRNFNNLGILFTTDKVGTESYSFRDGAELNATAYYRLKIVNKDNSTSYSKIVILSAEKTATNTTLSLLQNPVESTLSFQYKATAAGNNRLVIYNAMGVRVHSQELKMQKGLNSIALTLDGKINTGTYFLEISNGAKKSNVKMIKK